MTSVFFLRHGPTKENYEGRIQGQLPGVLLVKETERYLAAVIPLLRERNPAMLLSSDLKRSVATRKMLGKFLQLPDVKESATPLLREKAMGFYEGMLWSEVPPEFQVQRSQSRYDFRKFGGESNEDVYKRVLRTIQQLAQYYPNRFVCCITHAGWIEQLIQVAHAEGISPDDVANRTAIYEVELTPSAQLQYFRSINLKAQLPESD